MGILRKIGGFILSAAAGVLLVAAAWGWYGAAQEPAAADAGVPVYINGPFWEDGAWRGSAEDYERIAAAELVGGYTYVPLRTVFEACEVEVSWDSQEKLIQAELSWGRSLRMQVGADRAYIGDREVALEAAPFARDGVVYVPLRFVGEALGCGVDWRNGGQGPGFGGNAAPGVTGQVVYLTRNLTAGFEYGGWVWRINRQAGSVIEYIRRDKVWRLDCGSGQVTMQDKGGGQPRELGRLDLSPLAGLDREKLSWGRFYVQETPEGNWQARAGVGIRDDTGHIPGSWELLAWVAPELGKSYNTSFYSSCVGDRMEPLWISGAGGRGEICLPGEGEVLIIDDATGELVQRISGKILRWANGEQVLFGYRDRWELVDRQTGARRDLAAELLSEERKARLEEQIREYLPDFDEKYREAFWKNIGDEQNREPHAQLYFVGEEAGALKFGLVATYLSVEKSIDMNINIKI